MRRSEPELPERGDHTLRIVDGEIVGIHGDDVIVELGPRAQGVISTRKFDEPPAVGEVYSFKLHGQEESLWVLSLEESKTLDTWENMEEGSLVQGRVIRAKPGGLEVKVGPLHAFMPTSQTGVPRGEKPDVLVGRNLTCEVIGIDPERQRVFLSRKLVQQRERESDRDREVGHLKAGQVVQGRVSRIEDYGVFLKFGRGLEGLIHVSNLSHERVSHPSELVKPGETLDARVLYVKHRGKRIALGLKQLDANPWSFVEREFYVDQVVPARVTRVEEYGAFCSIAKGIEGLLHVSEAGLQPGRGAREHFHAGDELSVRIVELEPEEERLSLSLLHRNGARIREDEALHPEEWKSIESLREAPDAERLSSPLGDALRRALESGGSDVQFE